MWMLAISEQLNPAWWHVVGIVLALIVGLLGNYWVASMAVSRRMGEYQTKIDSLGTETADLKKEVNRLGRSIAALTGQANGVNYRPLEGG